ncbi:MAG: glucosamine-6-phosphate deaminase [Candidatus Thermoplasmatota archaeon]|nr:glucosamine-6-phosphate deaminase [Candidatus Thermoplasmatota archaeon]
MNIIRGSDYTSMSAKARDMVIDRISNFSDMVLAIPTGNTPEMLYSLLVDAYKKERVSFKDAVTFNLDEYVGISPDNPQSYSYYMKDHLLKHIDIGRSYIPDGLADDLERECAGYEDRIKEEGGIDLAILGIGRNGHIGFNEPGTNFESLTHVVELSEDTIKANARFFPKEEEVPRRAITMGIKTIMNAREVLLLASGKEKAGAIKKAVIGETTEELPASALQRHKRCTFIIDSDAASLLKNW